MKKLLLLFVLSFVCCNNTPATEEVKDYTSIHNEAMIFCKENQFNQDFYFLIDMSIHSGKNRFFVHDFKTKKVSHQNLVTHGTCDVFQTNPEKYKKARFSNKRDSHCSMKGKFKIGIRDYSSWGINVKYWLHGLESTNDNAVERVVVLHSWSAVSNDEIYPRYSPLSWGCPAVSDEFMQILDEKLKAVEKPVLLWIVE
ncbi:murein L,D-transpeptidase catalytic domain-containing protein [Flavobacterium sp.]|jgi:hypothetical protein|uniref:murein L,D-transpeptidase catalytic domain-containing protein n=1 Tax=Flavobacterium sp. TaxID=239 RepID=UPI0037C0160F